MTRTHGRRRPLFVRRPSDSSCALPPVRTASDGGVDVMPSPPPSAELSVTVIPPTPTPVPPPSQPGRRGPGESAAVRALRVPRGRLRRYSAPEPQVEAASVAMGSALTIEAVTVQVDRLCHALKDVLTSAGTSIGSSAGQVLELLDRAADIKGTPLRPFMQMLAPVMREVVMLAPEESYVEAYGRQNIEFQNSVVRCSVLESTVAQLEERMRAYADEAQRMKDDMAPVLEASESEDPKNALDMLKQLGVRHSSLEKFERHAINRLRRDSSTDLNSPSSAVGTPVGSRRSSKYRLVASMPTGMEMLEAAPIGEIALFFSDVQSSTRLWEVAPEAMDRALKLHNDLFRRLIHRFDGYEVKVEGDAFFVAFQSSARAVQFAARAQEDLMRLDYPPDLLRQPVCSPMLKKSAPNKKAGSTGGWDPDDADNYLFRGLRVRMGVHVGTPKPERNPITGRVDYFGAVVNRAARVAGSGAGGQIVVSEKVRHQIKDEMDDEERPFCLVDLGVKQFKGVSEPMKTFQVLPEPLKDREFTSSQITLSDVDVSSLLNSYASMACTSSSIPSSASNVNLSDDSSDEVPE